MSNSNLIRNLRKQWPVGPGNRSVCLTMDEAADKIEELESKIKDLKTKLAEYEKQKPIGWLHIHPDFNPEFSNSRLTSGDFDRGFREEPLYTFPALMKRDG